jgi:hypothetical protein
MRPEAAYSTIEPLLIEGIYFELGLIDFLLICLWKAPLTLTSENTGEKVEW